MRVWKVRYLGPGTATSPTTVHVMMNRAMNLRSVSLLSTLLTLGAYAQTSTSDCDGAIPLCGGVYTETAAPTGTGNVYEFTGTCNANLETSSLWYTFTVQSTGNLSFTLDPANVTDDYDWGLFNITSGGCAGINAQDGSSPEVNCNSYGSLVNPNGATGISSALGGTGTSNGPGDTNGPPFNADLPVQAGQTFALVVMNWTNSPNGYTIDFTQSTASLYDNINPYPVSVVPDCGNQHFHVIFSEPVVTSSVQPADFTITSPLGATTDVSTVTPDDATASMGAGYTVGLPSGLQDPGTYVFNVTFVSGNVEDACGNIVVDTTFQVVIPEPLHFDTLITTACNGTGGTVHVENVSGGMQPITFTLNGQPMANNTWSNLADGTYTLAATDSTGCVVQEPVVVPDHVIAVTIAQDQDSLSCLEPVVTIQGVTVQPDQNVQYHWTAVTVNGTDPNFSTSAAPNVSLPGTYTVLVTEPQSGCTAQAAVGIAGNSAPSVDLGTIVLPNVISPNGDGKNDVWKPFALNAPEMDITGLFDEYTFLIYNRWGQRVDHSTTGNQRSWDARDVPAGTYYYTVAYKAECGFKVDESRQGTITVLK